MRVPRWTIVAVCVGLVVLGWIGWRAVRGASSGVRSDDARAIGVHEYAAISARTPPLASALQRPLADAVTRARGLEAVSAAEAQALAPAVAAFMEARFGPESTPESYLRWREQQGDTPRTLEEMRTRWVLDADEEHLLGASLGSFATQRGLFVALMGARRGEEQKRGLRAFADGPGGYAVAFGVMTPEDDREPFVSGGLRDDGLWYGSIGTTARPWWAPARPLAEVITRHGEAKYAVVAMVGVFADGSRHPVHTHWYYDPVRGRWQLEAVLQQNHRADRALFIEY